MTLITLSHSVIRELAQDAARDFLHNPDRREEIVQSINHFDNPVFLRLVQVYLHEVAQSQAFFALRKN